MPQLVQHSNSCIAVQCLEASWMISWINLSSFMWGLIRSCIGPAITSGNLQLVYLVSFSNSQPSSDMCTFSFPIVVKQCNNFVASSGSTYMSTSHPSDICQLRDYIKKGVGNSRELLRERWTKKAAGFGGTCFGGVLLKIWVVTRSEVLGYSKLTLTNGGVFLNFLWTLAV